MPLPTIVTPKYPITIPSSKKKTTYRPFLMKEQKVLYSAIESDDQKQIYNAMCMVIKECVDDIKNPETLPMFDLEYIFLRLRAKSAGELIDLAATCPKCDTKNKIQINLETVEVEFPENHSNKIMLTETLGVIMRYPQFSDSLIDLSNLGAEKIVDYICDSIEVVFDDNMTYTRKDFTPMELKDFVDSMNSSQFENVADFYKKMPKLKKQVECTCINCQENFKVDFSGLNDFFT